jgi:hypothetical protein
MSLRIDSQAEPIPGYRLLERIGSGDARKLVEEAGAGEFVPPEDPAVTEAMWLEAARAHFRGRVVLGRDLLEI